MFCEFYIIFMNYIYTEIVSLESVLSFCKEENINTPQALEMQTKLYTKTQEAKSLEKKLEDFLLDHTQNNFRNIKEYLLSLA